MRLVLDGILSEDEDGLYVKGVRHTSWLGQEIKRLFGLTKHIRVTVEGVEPTKAGEHRCYMPPLGVMRDVDEYTGDGAWVLSDDNEGIYTGAIIYCPVCGEKLE